MSGFYTAPGENPVQPQFGHCSGGGWFVNVPISPDAPSTLTFSFQNGAKTVSKTVEWIETNTLSEPDTTIRLGDSLLLNAYPEGATDGHADITVEGNTMTVSPGNPVPYKFENSGEIQISSTYYPVSGSSVSATMTVNVVKINFATAPTVFVGETRPWNNPDIPTTQALLQSDSSINFSSAQLDPDGTIINLYAKNDSKAYITARLDSEFGPVADSLRVAATKCVDANTNYQYTVVCTFSNGDLLIESTIALSYVPDDLNLTITIKTAGVLFDNGTTELHVTAADFDENGVLTYRAIQAADKTGSICHWIDFYQDDILIGDGVYIE